VAPTMMLASSSTSSRMRVAASHHWHKRRPVLFPSLARHREAQGNPVPPAVNHHSGFGCKDYARAATPQGATKIMTSTAEEKAFLGVAVAAIPRPRMWQPHCMPPEPA
jgi:hypothetical protein